MSTIAELQIKVDSSQAEKGVKVLNDLATAADKAAKARKALNDVSGPGNGGGGGGGGADDAEAKKTRNLSEAIDAQTRKLADLAAQRKKLNDSPMKTENPAEYARLNREIDARTELVNRQGNSLDRLAAQANKEQAAREKASKSAQALAEREAKQLEAREALQARLAASQQRQLDSTIAGLSAQIRAQQDYNKTIEVLSLNRFQGKIGGGEFDTLTRMAAARRDEALAIQDNSKELERNQRMLDSITATLGRTERAEVTLKRAVDTLNEGLKTGLLTQEQYDKQLSLHTAKRDSAIAAANNNTAAEERFTAQLKSVLAAYNPVIQANETYTASMKVLIEGMIQGKVTTEQYNGAMRHLAEQLERVKAAQAGSPEQQGKQYQTALDRLLPFNAQLRNLAESERALQAAQRNGLVVTADQIKSHDQATRAIAAERAEIERRTQAEKRGNSAKQDAAALRGLPAQFTDVVVSLQGGQAPLTVLLQQGGQVKDMFGGVGNALKAVGGALLAMITPAVVVGGALAAIALGFYQGASEAVSFNKAIAQSAGYSGASRESFLTLQKSISEVAGTMGMASESLIEMQKSGKISVEQFEAIGIAAAKMQLVTGQSIADTVADFASLGKDPTQAVVSLDEKYKFLTASVYLQVAALQREGDIMGATTLAQQEMANGAATLADTIKENLGTIEKSWKLVKEGAASAWDAMRGIGREVSKEDQIGELQKRIELMQKYGQPQYSEAQGKTVFGESGIKDLQDELQVMQFALGVTNKQKEAIALLNKEKEQGRQADVLFGKQLNTDFVANTSQVDILTNKIAVLNRGFTEATERAKKNNTVVDSNVIDTYNKTVANLDKKLVSAKEQAAKSAGPSSPVDSREVQDVKSNLNVILSEYDGYYKKVTALGKANVVSAEATYASQKAVLQAEAKAVSESYDEQISAIKKLQDKKGNNTAQTISLANQMSKAEDQRTKSMQDNAAKQERLDIEEKGRIDAKTSSIEAYNDALKLSIENTALAGQRAVSAVGQGDRQGKLNDDLASNDRQFAKDTASLAKQLGKGMDEDEFLQKTAILKKAHSDMTQQILKNDRDIKEAEGDWTNGVTKAIQNHMDEAANLAKVMESAVTGAFDSMGDALGDFVTTGKLDFASLTASILSDLARMAAKLALNSALKMVFESASSSGGWGGLISAGVSAVTGGGTAMAKGGAYNGGTQFFAKGGAFTNSVVSSPTAFTSSNGSNNVMGEAGPEAIMPLARSSDGSLGVRMVGAAGGGATGSGGVVVYVTIDKSGQSATDTDSSDPLVNQFGKELGAFIETKYRTLLTRDLKDGGAIKSAMRS